MWKSVLQSIVAIAVVQASNAQAADPCALIPIGEASALVGQTVQGHPEGPEKDEDSPGQLSSCSYFASAAPAGALIVSVVEFQSGAEAKKYLTRNLVQSRMDDETAKVTEEGGIGERSFYGAAREGAMYIFLVKNKVAGVGLGGPPEAKAKASKDALRKTAQSVAARL